MSQPPAHIQQQPINGYCWDASAYKQINNLPVADHHHHHYHHHHQQSGQNPNAHYLPQAGHMYLPPGAGLQPPPPPPQQQQQQQQQSHQQQVQHVGPQVYQVPGPGQVEEDMYHVPQAQHRQQPHHQQAAPFQPAVIHQAYCPQQVPSPPSVQLPHALINHHLQHATAASNVRYHPHSHPHPQPHHQYSQPTSGRALGPAIYHQQNQYSETMQQHYELIPSHHHHHQQATHCQQRHQDNFYDQLGGFSELVAPPAPPPPQTLHVEGGGGAVIDEFDAALHNHHQSEAAIANELYYQNQMDLHPTIKQQQEAQQKLAAAAQQRQQQNASQMSPKALVLAPQPPSQQQYQQRKQQQQPPHNLEQFHSRALTHPGGHQQQQQQTNSMVAPPPAQPQSLNGGQSADLGEAEQRQRSQSTAAPAFQQSPPPWQQRQPTGASDSGLGNQLQAGNTSRDQPKQQERQRQGQQQDLVEMGSHGSLSQDWLDTICRHLIEHMSQFGICVIDNFLGSLKGESILKEVQQLYQNGQHYSKGRVVSNKPGDLGTTNAIRNDWVIWIDGCEDGCAEINNLIQTLCSVITNSARLSLYSNNGLDKVVINKRTKAHVSCYPGNGTRYIKHVDNPNGDGRVITSIYYLNKNWFTKRDGGLLRMFPAGMNEVANIEPLFDRALFFWSDRRNPHEVLPAYRDRYAITVWYIGEERPQV